MNSIALVFCCFLIMKCALVACHKPIQHMRNHLHHHGHMKNASSTFSNNGAFMKVFTGTDCTGEVLENSDGFYWWAKERECITAPNEVTWYFIGCSANQAGVLMLNPGNTCPPTSTEDAYGLHLMTSNKCFNFGQNVEGGKSYLVYCNGTSVHLPKEVQPVNAPAYQIETYDSLNDCINPADVMDNFYILGNSSTCNQKCVPYNGDNMNFSVSETCNIVFPEIPYQK